MYEFLAWMIGTAVFTLAAIVVLAILSPKRKNDE
jgi:hypothetical protein